MTALAGKAQIPLSLHAKQMEVYQSKARFRVVVAGRRWGKCLHTGSMIEMANGTQKPIEAIVPGDLVLTTNEYTYQLEARAVQAVESNGIKETVVIKTAGRSLRSTPHHPILANNAWINAGDLKVGDLIAVPKHLAFGVKELPEHVVDLLAIWLAEGRGYGIANQDPSVVKVMFDAAAKFGLTPKSKDGLNWALGNGNRTGGPQAGTKNSMRQMLQEFNLWGKNSKTKFIPDEVFALNERQLARFLNLFFATDGCISKRSKSTWAIEMGLANERMTTQLASLLHKFGIRTQISHKVHKACSSVTGIAFESWRLIASDAKSIIKFSERIGAIGKEKQVELARAAAKLSAGSSNSYLPISHDDFVKHLKYESTSKGKFGGYNCAVARDLPEPLRAGLNSWRKQTPSRVSVRRYEALQGYSDGFFDSLANEDIAWEEVTSVEAAEPAQTWDLSIDGNHNFVANGIVVHNTALSRVLMIRHAKLPRQRIWYVAPTYRMAKQIMWTDLVDAVPKRWIRKVNETNMAITLVNGSIIELKGADKADSLRGVGIHFLVLDEFQDMSEETWTQVLRPTLADTGGNAIFIGTPKAYNHLFDLYKHGQDAAKKASRQWESWQFPTITSPFIPKFEIEAARADMDEKSFKQEFLASFETMSGRVYYPFDRSEHVGQYPFNPTLPIWVGMDFNIDPMSAVIFQPQPDGEIWAVDEIVQFGSNTEEICKELDRKYWRIQNQITMYPDPAGGQRQHARGETDLDILRENNLKKIKFRRKHPPVADRVNAVNRMLRAADGTVKMRIDARCKHLITALEQTIYKAGSRDVDKDAGTEHSADAAGYCIELEFPVRRVNVLGVSL